MKEVKKNVKKKKGVVEKRGIKMQQWGEKKKKRRGKKFEQEGRIKT